MNESILSGRCLKESPSLNESIEIFRDHGKAIDTIISIGGGAKNENWSQMQADIFNATIVKLSSEQGPGMGAAMLAAYGSGWFSSLKECAESFIESAKTYQPNSENVERYKKYLESISKCIRKRKK